MAGKRFCNCWAMIVEKSGAPPTPPLTPSTFPLTPFTPLLTPKPWSFPWPFNSSTRSSLPPLGPLPLPPLPTRSPVPLHRDSATGRPALLLPALRVLILGGIIYMRENIGNI
ncbi:hypothetical protein Tco_0062858, partial [Tanacetum coccineum]